MKAIVKPAEAIMSHHSSPNDHSVVTAVVAFKAITNTMKRSVAARLTRTRLVCVLRFLKLATAMQTREFPIRVASIINKKNMSLTKSMAAFGLSFDSVEFEDILLLKVELSFNMFWRSIF